ncbi:MAG: hypothetical protein AAF363_05960 [Bacteroidota bacterium]
MKKSVLTFTVGAAAGAIAGLLLAPVKGSQVRRAFKAKSKPDHHIRVKEKSTDKNIVDLSSSSFFNSKLSKEGISDFIYHS